MEEKLLEIKDLSVEYTTDEDIVKAVNHVSLTLNKGETIGLVGETGAGKTTLALSLMRLLPKVSGRITGGEIMFNGEDLVKAAEEDMRKDIHDFSGPHDQLESGPYSGEPDW